MNNGIKKYAVCLVMCINMCFGNLPTVLAQQLFSYSPDESTASIHYNDFLFGIYKNSYKKLPAYPLKGVYSPTHYSDVDRDLFGTGVCNYIYIPTNATLVPGHQYRISLTVKFVKAYAQMPYYQLHFGVALASELFENYMGLWPKHFVPLGVKT